MNVATPQNAPFRRLVVFASLSKKGPRVLSLVAPTPPAARAAPLPPAA